MFRAIQRVRQHQITRNGDMMIKFWKQSDEWGVFSNWYKIPYFVPPMGLAFTCVEQGMVAAKALAFRDWGKVGLIMDEEHPRKIKEHGRTVWNYDDEYWSKIRYNVVYTHCYYKWAQNPEVQEALKKTEDYPIVEASPLDKVWGVGLRADDPRIEDHSKWRGQNLLGKIWMEIRECT